MRRIAAALCFAGAALGCSGIAPVPGYPWIEDRSLSLEHEALLLGVERAHVSVAARFAFVSHSTPQDRVLTFPVPPPCDRPPELRATILVAGAAPTRLAVRPAAPGKLPAGEVAASFDIEVPAAAFAAGRGVLLVQYRQRCGRRFRYTLKTGAYWRGPIGQLDVVVVDPHRRVRAAATEGRPAARVAQTSRVWSWLAVEPHTGVELELAPSERLGSSM